MWDSLALYESPVNLTELSTVTLSLHWSFTYDGPHAHLSSSVLRLISGSWSCCESCRVHHRFLPLLGCFCGISYYPLWYKNGRETVDVWGRIRRKNTAAFSWHSFIQTCSTVVAFSPRVVRTQARQVRQLLSYSLRQEVAGTSGSLPSTSSMLCPLQFAIEHFICFLPYLRMRRYRKPDR